VNGSDSVIAASSLIVELIQDGTVTAERLLVGEGLPQLYLMPGDNWFAFGAGGRAPVEEMRLRPPQAEYADLPGTFDTTINVTERPGGVLVSGTVTSGWPTDLENVLVNIVWLDSSGQPTLGIQRMAGNLGPGETAEFGIETKVAIDESWTQVANVVSVRMFRLMGLPRGRLQGPSL